MKYMKIKLIMLGDTGVGKTSIISRKNNDSFSNTFSSTIGVDFASFKTVCDDCSIHTNVWDTGGQERFKFIIRSYFNDVSGVVLVYDITNHESFEHLKMWREELDRYEFNNRIILVGCKTDMYRKRQVSVKEASDYANEHNFLFQECSAKDDENIETMFNQIIFAIKDDVINGITKPTRENGISLDNISSFTIEMPNNHKSKKYPTTNCCAIL